MQYRSAFYRGAFRRMLIPFLNYFIASFFPSSFIEIYNGQTALREGKVYNVLT